MKGDILILQNHHRRAASVIVPHIIDRIRRCNTRYIITVAEETGSGKSETAKAIADELEKSEIKSVLLGQDDYFILPPRSNDHKRREDPEWLGPHVEVKLDVMEQNLVDAIQGKREITKPLVDYDSNTIDEESINLDGIKVLIAEGTYTSLLKHVDTRIFIARNWHLMKHFFRTTLVVMILFVQAKWSAAQSLNGSWYGLGTVVGNGEHSSYMAELKLNQRGRLISGTFSYYFRDSLFTVKRSGTYDAPTK